MDLQKKASHRDKKLKGYFHKDASHGHHGLPHAHPAPAKRTFGHQVFLTWNALEFEKSDWETGWYLAALLALAGIIVYALISDNPIMAITFILIGVVGYIYLEKEPRRLEFKITGEGVVAGSEIYEYRNVRSFWIFYEPHFKVVSLHMKSMLLPYIHIPIDKQDPGRIHELLSAYIPEVEQEHTLINGIERLLRI